MKNYKGGFIVPLVIAIIIIAGGIAYYAVQKSNSSNSVQATSSTSVPVPSDSQTPVVSDEQAIQNVVLSMIQASRSVVTFQDAQNVIQKYYTQASWQKIQTGMSKLDAKTQSTMQGFVVKENQSMPDPSTIKYVSTTINANLATTTYIYLKSPIVTQGGKPVATNQKSYFIVGLKNENSQWLVDHITFSTK